MIGDSYVAKKVIEDPNTKIDKEAHVTPGKDGSVTKIANIHEMTNREGKNAVSVGTEFSFRRTNSK